MGPELKGSHPDRDIEPDGTVEAPASYSHAFQTAWKKGREAARGGLSPDDCPYRDDGNRARGVNFSRAFRKWWRDGFDSVGPSGLGESSGEVGR